MNDFKYSAVIRATKSSIYLNKTIESLLLQKITPAEIIIVIPYGEDINISLTDDIPLKIVKAPRGMVSQRAQGVLLANQNMLLLDADVYLGCGAVEILLWPIEIKKAHCVVPMGSYLKRTKLGRFLDIVFGIRIPRRQGGISVTPGGGFFVPKDRFKLPYYETEIGPGLAMALSKEFAMNNNIIGDFRFENKYIYAYLEDAAFVMDVVQKGGCALITDRANLIHLDEGITREKVPYQSFFALRLYNHYLFFKFYIWPKKENILSKVNAIILYLHFIFGNLFIEFLVGIKNILISGSIVEMKYIGLGFLRFIFIVMKKEICK